MKISPLDIGPQLGHTTSNSVKIWGRFENKHSEVGIVRLTDVVLGTSQIETFEFNSFFDFCGVVELRGLRPGVLYQLQCGAIAIETSLEDLNDADWKPIEKIQFYSFASGAKESQFLLGCGRYDDVKDKEKIPAHEKCFKSALDEIRKGHLKVDFSLMLGEQIYIKNRKGSHVYTIDSFWKKYRQMWKLPFFSILTSTRPVYMVLGENDIQEKWSRERFLDPNNSWYQAQTYENGIQAFKAYQALHSPLDIDKEGQPLWYTFKHGPSNFFVCDCRSERKEHPENDTPHMISVSQMEALKSWLKNDEEKIKFIVMSTPMVPEKKAGLSRFNWARKLHLINMDVESNGWDDFVEQRNEILEYIREKKIERVVILSAGPKCSMALKIKHVDDPDFMVYHISSSAFNLPEFSSPKRFIFSLPLPIKSNENGLPDLKKRGPWTLKPAALEGVMRVHSQSNFAHLIAHLDGLNLTYMDATGKVLEEEFLPF